MKKFVILLLAPLCLLGTGCQQLVLNLPGEPLQDSVPTTVAVSDYGQKHIHRVALKESTAEVNVYIFDRSKIRMQIHHNREPKLLQEWADSLPESDFVVNGGYFLENYEPAGALLINGVAQSSRVYDFERSGLFYVKNGYLEIIDTKNLESLIEFQSEDTSYLQSFPFLIKDGESAIQEDSERLARRTVIGTSSNSVFLVIVDSTPVSLYELMKILLEVEPDIEMALNLDGGPSTGLINRVNDEKFLSLSPLPQILSISPRPPD